ncbi:MAG TPA: hypothetical protein PLK35_02320, partial [Candidatus Moranbacteria bacterium]|nr:hypothetical protein [Candidatus Moranbacteria bacterium]
MFTFPNPKTTDPRERRVQRILEVIPGILTWATILGMFILSFLVPIWVAVFIIAFDIYWIYRTIFIAYYSVVGYRKLRKGKGIDWWERCQNISDPEKYEALLAEKIIQMKRSLKVREKMTRKEIKILKKEIKDREEYLKEVKKLKKIKDQILD